MIHSVDLWHHRRRRRERSQQRRRPGVALRDRGGDGGELFKNANDFRGPARQAAGGTERRLRHHRFAETDRPSQSVPQPQGEGHDNPACGCLRRAGYYEPKPFSSTTLVEKNLTAADVIASEIPVHDVPVSVSAQAFAAADSAIADGADPGARGASALRGEERQASSKSTHTLSTRRGVWRTFRRRRRCSTSLRSRCGSRRAASRYFAQLKRPGRRLPGAFAGARGGCRFDGILGHGRDRARFLEEARPTSSSH